MRSFGISACLGLGGTGGYSGWVAVVEGQQKAGHCRRGWVVGLGSNWIAGLSGVNIICKTNELATKCPPPAAPVLCSFVISHLILCRPGIGMYEVEEDEGGFVVFNVNYLFDEL